MIKAAVPAGDRPGIHWRSLGSYIRAIGAFTRTAAPILERSSFARIAASDWSDLPPAQTFPVPSASLGFRHYPAADSKRVLVLIHGSGCFGDLAHEMAVRIVRRNAAHVYTLDMRGHGRSSGPRGHAIDDQGQMIGDVAAFIRHLQATRDRPQITLGGHSAGGGIVLAFARSPAADLVSSYLFLAPFLGFGSEVDRPHFGGWVRLRIGVLRLLTLANVLGITRFNGSTVVDFNIEAAGDPRYVPSWSFSTLLAFGPDRWSANARPLPAHKPVLVLACSDDECFSQRHYAGAFAVVAPHAELPEVGPGGHWDLLVDAKAAQLAIRWLEAQNRRETETTHKTGRRERAA